MKKYLVSIFFVCALLIVQTKQAAAHVGGGPPFLEINGKYALTNPFFSNDPTINIPQDNNPETFPLVVNQPITFAIDTSKLLVPSDIAAASTFRWSFYERGKDYKYGTSLTYAYPKPGSYLITIEVKGPTDTDYLIIDTVQVNILPNAQYQVPKTTIGIETTHHQSNQPIFFKTTIAIDKTAKIKSTIWVFGDGESSSDQNVLHQYKKINDYSTFPVVFRIVDGNNFISDTGVIVQSISGKLSFIDANGQTTQFPVSDVIKTQSSNPLSKKNSINSYFIVFISIVTVISLVIVFFIRKK